MTPEDRRLQLLNADYDPIPCNGKHPVMDDWAARDKTNPAEIGMWSSPAGHPFAQNTGIRTKFTPAIDIDIMDEEVAEAFEDLARKTFEEHEAAPCRIGKAPKRALLLRTDEPFKKLVRLFVPKNGVYDLKKPPRIEILCEGQQLIAFGIHPDTHQRYNWPRGAPGEIKREDLPYVRKEDMIAFLDAAEKRLEEEFGWTAIPERPAKARGNGGEAKGYGADDWGWLFDNILQGRELHDSIRDLAAKMVAAHPDDDGSDGAIVNQLRALTQHSRARADRPDDWQEEYDDIPRAVSSARAKFGKPKADQPPPSPPADDDDILPREVKREDFVAYMVMHNYAFLPTRELWPASSVDARITPINTGKLDKGGKPIMIKATLWLDQNRPVEQMTWAPGEPMLIKDRLISEGGWITRPGSTVLNVYRPPTLELGDANKAGPWLDHLKKVYPNDADHIERVLAHRVQRPHDKINHALFLGGPQGIGKDSLIEPVRRGVGPWNVQEVTPRVMLETRFNGYLKSVILRISEARDLGDYNRFVFYDHMKTYTAAPPDTLRVDEKNLREYHILNCCFVIITSNYKMDGIYLPADDRRHYVAWSDLTKDDFDADYWNKLWQYYDNGGDRNVVAYLASRDLSKFDPKAPPPKTEAFWAIVNANRAPEDAELQDVLDGLGNPRAVTLIDVQDELDDEDDFRKWLCDRKNRRIIPHRFENCGYVPVRNTAGKDELWVVDGKRQVVYAKASLSLREQLEAALRLSGGQQTAFKV